MIYQCQCSVITRLCKAKTGQPENTLADEVSKDIAGHKAEHNCYSYSRCNFFEGKDNKYNDTDVSTYLQYDNQQPNKIRYRKYTGVKLVLKQQIQ